MIITSVQESYYGVNDIFTSDEGLQFGFAITSYNGSEDVIEDPLYGLMVAKKVTWGIEEDIDDVAQEDLPLTSCVDEQFQLNSAFYTPQANSVSDVSRYQAKLKCIDKKVEISGEYSSQQARALKLVFEKCDQEKLELTDPDATCKTDEEISTWLQRKFIIVLSNQERFNSTTQQIDKDSKLTWIQINSLSRQEHAWQIQITDIQQRIELF